MKTPTTVTVECDRIIGNLFAEVALDHIDAGIEQRPMRLAPPRIRFGIGEIHDAAVRQRRECGAEWTGFRRRIPSKNVRITRLVGEQIAARRQLFEQRRVNRHIRIFPNAHAKIVLLDGRDGRPRIGKTLGVPPEIEPCLDIPRGTAIQRHHVGRDLALPKLRGDGCGFLRRLVIGA